MSKLFNYTGKRGRPAIVLNYPQTGTFTPNTLVEMNPHVKCRLSIYHAMQRMVKAKILRYTGKTVKTGGPGKPLLELQSMAAYRAARAKRKARRTAKLASIPPVDISPAPQPVIA